MRRGFTAVLLTVLALVWVAAASPTTSSITSQPNGDIRVIVSVGCGATDRDRDGDFNTCTKGDTASLFFAVDNASDVTQTIRIDYVLDRPGTEFDRAFTQEVVIEPNAIHQERDELRIENKKTPLGEYTLTVTAVGSETASTSTFLTVR
jgi:hypothetical protein